MLGFAKGAHPNLRIRCAVRAASAFVVLWVLYQSAEGIGTLWLHNDTVRNTFMVACVVIAWPLSRWLGYRGFGAYALNGNGWWHWLPACLLLAVLAKFAAVAAGLQLGAYASDPAGGAAGSIAVLAALPVLLIVTFVPSLAEDILTRGFWYRASGIRWRGGIVFVVVSAAIFVLNHIYRLSNGPLEWALVFAMGLPYAAALWRTGSLWAALGLHWGWNLGNGLQALVLPVTAGGSEGGTFMSIAAHLVMFAIVLIWRHPHRAFVTG